MKEISPSLIEVLAFNINHEAIKPLKLVNSNASVIKIENCPSIEASVDFVERNFHHFPRQIKLVVVRVEESTVWLLNPLEIEKINEKFKKNSLIVSFESPRKSPKVLHKLNDEKLSLIEDFKSLSSKDFCNGNFNFENFLRGLKSGVCGKFDDSLLDVEVDLKKYFKASIENQKVEKFNLLDLARQHDDATSLKFLQLFSIDLYLKDKNNDRPLENAVKNHKNSAFKTLLDVDELSTIPDLKDIKCLDALRLLHDTTGFNLLMIASQSNNQEVLDFFLKFKILDVNFKANDQKTALDVAMIEKNYEIILKLLLHDARYSEDLEKYVERDLKESIEKNSDILKKISAFYDDMREVHDLITKVDETVTKVQRFLVKYPNLTHFFNASSESLSYAAIKADNAESYEFLLSKGITLSHHEDINELFKKDDVDLQRKYRDVHRKFVKSPIEAHLMRIFARIQIGHDVKAEDRRNLFILAVDAIKKLNEVPEIENLLETISVSDELNLIFEFNRNSVDQLDPTSDKATLGMTYLNGWIYLGVKGLLENFKNAAHGTIAHEICHYAMQLVFENVCKPYGRFDGDLRKEFKEIVKEYQAMAEHDEEIISRVFKCYEADMWIAELIVRVPELCAFYQDDPEKLKSVRSKHFKLFDFYAKIYEKFLKRAPQLIAGKQQVKFINSMIGMEHNLTVLSREIEFKPEVGSIFKNFKGTKTTSKTTIHHEIFQKSLILHSNSPKLTLLAIHQDKSFESVIFSTLECLRIPQKLKAVQKVHKLPIQPLLVVSCEQNLNNMIDNAEILAKVVKDLCKKLPARVVFVTEGVDYIDIDVLRKSPLNLQFHKVDHQWNDFAELTQRKLLTSDVSFQGKVVKLRDLIPNTSSSVFNAIPLNKLMNEKLLKFGNELKFNEEFYYERSLLKEIEKENVKQIVTCTTENDQHSHHSGHQHSHSHGHSHNHGTNEFFKHANKGDSHDSNHHKISQEVIFEHQHSQDDHTEHQDVDLIDDGVEISEGEFLENSETLAFSSKDQKTSHLSFRNAIKVPSIIELPHQEVLKAVISKEEPKVHHHHHHSKETEIVNFSFEDLLNEQVMVLSDEPGMGKSTSFRHFALKLKEKFANFWILYIDLKLYFEIYQQFKDVAEWSLESLTRIFSKMFNYDDFEVEVFKELLSMKKVIFLIDGVDEISPNFKEFIFNLAVSIKNHANCKLWIASRPHCVSEFEGEFQVVPCRLEPIDGAKFLTEFLRAKKIPESEAKKIQKFIDELSVAIWKNIDYKNPMLIRIITKIHEELEVDDNLFSIYDKFVQKIFATLINSGVLRQSDLVQSTTFSVPIVILMHQRIALESCEDRITNEDLKSKLKGLKIFRINCTLTIYQLFGFGILYGQSIDKCFFIHQTFAEFFTSKFTVDDILIDLTARESEIEVKLEFLWHLLTEKTNKNVLRFIDCYLKNNHEKLPTDSKDILKSFFRSKAEGISSTFFSSVKSFFSRQKSSVLSTLSLKQTIFYLFESHNESVIQFILRLFKDDMEMLRYLFSITKPGDCSVFCVVSDIFPKSLWCLWEVSVELLNAGGEKAFLKNFLCCNRHNHPPIDVAIIQLRAEDLSKFFYSLPSVYDEGEFRELLSIKSYSEYTIFERTVLRMVCSSEFFEAMKRLELFWSYARNYFEDGGCRFELFVKVVKELSFNYHKTPFEKKDWFERFIFVIEEATEVKLARDDIRGLLTYKTTYSETILHHITNCLKSDVVEGLLEEVRQYLTADEQKNLLDKDFQQRSPFLKICSVQNLVNLEILWNFIKNLLTRDEQRRFLLETDINQWNALHYILMLSRSHKKEQIEMMIRLYEDFFDGNQMKSFMTTRNIFDETILFECFQNYDDLHDAVCFYYQKMLTTDEIKEFLSFRNAGGKSAFCVKKSFSDNEKILKNMKFVSDFVQKNFSEKERNQLLTIDGKKLVGFY